MSIFDFALNLAWLIPLFPFLAFVAILLFTYRHRRLSHQLAVGGLAASTVLSQAVFWAAVLVPVGGGERAFESARVPWLPLGLETFSLGVYVDPATAAMLFMVPLVCLMIFMYSVGSMEGDPRYSRFFAYASLFAASMLGMVVFNNLLAFFIFWEIMDTCSYLLIGFWYEKKSALQAGLKAFLVTRVGDLFFVLGLALLYSATGSLAYRDVFHPQTLEHLAHTGFLGTQVPVAAVIALLFLGGTVGKSAQFPLHVWLPDAMEGPTPVSALVHAATVVSAGVFLIVRSFPLLAALGGGLPMTIVASVGAFTAIFASLIAIAQNDVRRVLAFSTISQAGYMIAALGLGAYAAGTFHLLTHAFCKALLLLGAGSVVHAMKVGQAFQPAHATAQFNPNDMAHMGGLARPLRRTFWTFLIGGLALAGFPLTAGFWSQDEILAQAYASSPAVFWTLAVAAGLTAFYTARLVCLTFLGQPRTAAAAHAPESPPAMTIPLIVLAAFAVGAGWAGVPEHFPGLGGRIPNWFHRFVGQTVGQVANLPLPATEHTIAAASGFTWQPLAFGLAFALGGLALGWLVYGWKPVRAEEMDRLERAMRRVWLGWLYDVLRAGFYWDRLYQATFVRGSLLLADLCHTFDRRVVDGLVSLAGRGSQAISRFSDWLDGHVVDTSVNLAGRAGRGLSSVSGVFEVRVMDRLADLIGLAARTLAGLSAVVDARVIDRAVDGVGNATLAGGRFLRPIQTGKAQNYLLLASLMVLALIAAFFMILFLRI